MVDLTQLISSVTGLLGKQYFGMDISGIVLFLGILALFFILGKVANLFIRSTLKKAAEKTSTMLDDILLDIIDGPVLGLFVIIGFYAGLIMLNIQDPGIESVLVNILGTLIIVVLTWFSIRLVDNLIDKVITPLTAKTKSKIDDQIMPILKKVSKITLIAIAGIIILQNFGYDVTAMIAGLGIGGLAFALAAQDTISNVFSGMTIFIDKPFTIKDWVTFNGVSGEVSKIGLRTTRIRDINGWMITVPNNKVAGNIITNVSVEKKRRKSVTLGLVYDTPMKKMNQGIELLHKIFKEHPDVADEGNIVRFMEFNSSSLDLQVIYFINNLSRKFDVMHEINMKIKEEFEKAGIEMAYPTQTVYTKKL